MRGIQQGGGEPNGALQKAGLGGEGVSEAGKRTEMPRSRRGLRSNCRAGPGKPRSENDIEDEGADAPSSLGRGGRGRDQRTVGQRRGRLCMERFTERRGGGGGGLGGRESRAIPGGQPVAGEGRMGQASLFYSGEKQRCRHLRRASKRSGWTVDTHRQTCFLGLPPAPPPPGLSSGLLPPSITIPIPIPISVRLLLFYRRITPQNSLPLHPRKEIIRATGWAPPLRALLSA